MAGCDHELMYLVLAIYKEYGLSIVGYEFH